MGSPHSSSQIAMKTEHTNTSLGKKKKIETPYIKHYSPNKRVSSTILQELPKSLLKGLERMWDIGQSRSLGPLLVHSFTYEWVHAASSLPGAKCYAKC